MAHFLVGGNREHWVGTVVEVEDVIAAHVLDYFFLVGYILLIAGKQQQHNSFITLRFTEVNS